VWDTWGCGGGQRGYSSGQGTKGAATPRVDAAHKHVKEPHPLSSATRRTTQPTVTPMRRGPWTGRREAGSGGSASGDGSCVSPGRPYQSSSWPPLTPSSAPSSQLPARCPFDLGTILFYFFPRARKRAPESHHPPTRCAPRDAASALPRQLRPHTPTQLGTHHNHPKSCAHPTPRYLHIPPPQRPTFSGMAGWRPSICFHEMVVALSFLLFP
jgi:hypothetical protein